MVGASCGNTGGSRRVFRPGRGRSVATSDGWGRGTRFDGDGDGDATCRRVVRVSTGCVRHLPRPRLDVAGLRFQHVRAQRREIPWPCQTCTARFLPREERLERARRERRWFAGPRPGGRRREQRVGSGRRRAMRRGGGDGLLGPMIAFRGHSCPRLGVAGSGFLERLVTPGGLRSNRGGRLPADSTVGCRVTRQRWRHRERTPVSFVTSFLRWTCVDSTVEGSG